MATGNTFLDKEFAETGPTPEMGARRLVQVAKQSLQQQQQVLENIRKIVARHGKPALVTALGTDEATALQAYYNGMKALVEASAPNVAVAEME